MTTPYCPRSTIGGHACANYQPENRCVDCPLKSGDDLKPFDDINPDFQISRRKVYSMNEINAYRIGATPPPACQFCAQPTTLMPGHTATSVWFTCAACDGPGMAELTPEQAEALRESVPLRWGAGAGIPMGDGVGTRVPRYPGLDANGSGVDDCCGPLGSVEDVMSTRPFAMPRKPPGKLRRLAALLADFAIESCEDTAQTLRMVREMLAPTPLPPWSLIGAESRPQSPQSPLLNSLEDELYEDPYVASTGGGIFKGGLGG